MRQLLSTYNLKHGFYYTHPIIHTLTHVQTVSRNSHTYLNPQWFTCI